MNKKGFIPELMLYTSDAYGIIIKKRHFQRSAESRYVNATFTLPESIPTN